MQIKHRLEIVDSHFHIWDLNQLHLPWLSSCRGKLDKSFSMDDLEKAYGKYDLDFKGGIYIEVDCDDRLKEDDYIYGIRHPKILAKIIRAKLKRNMRLPLGIAGVREPLHIDSSIPGRCLEESFIAGLEVLAQAGLVFEACTRTNELDQLYNAVKGIPQLKLVINHMGNITELSEKYKKDMQALASLPNIYCKVSGYETKNKTFVRELLDFTTHTFDHNRLMYASNFPVVSLYSSFDEHLQILLDYFNGDEAFFSKTAKKLYQINPIQRFGAVIKVRPEKVEYYKKLHANPFAGVNKMIEDSGITKYHIFLRDDLLFSYLEYQGDNFDWDMAQMAKDPLTKIWWEETDPCQYRIKGAGKDEWWASMEEVYSLKKEIK